jgi:hypothetical protein
VCSSYFSAVLTIFHSASRNSSSAVAWPQNIWYGVGSKLVYKDFKWKQVTGDTVLSISSQHVCFVFKKSQLQRPKKISYTGFHSFPLFQVNSKNTVNLIHFLFKGHTVAQLVEAQAGRLTGSTPDGVTGIFDIILPGLWPWGRLSL